MARATLPRALELMFGHEGGYSNVKSDAGGPTKYGVTHKTLAAHRGVASVSPDQVKALTLSEAEDIYRKGYWTQSGGDLLPVGLDYAAFDFGVNSGPARAVKVLQRLVGVGEDGNAGPQTLAAVEAYPRGLATLISDYCEARMDFLRALTNSKTGFPKNGRGWTIRVIGVDPKGEWADQPGVRGNALAMLEHQPVVKPSAAPAGGDAKAIPETNPWTKPEVVLQGVGAAGGVSFLFTGTGPVQIAIGAVLVLAAVVAAVYFIRRIGRTPA